MKPDKSAPYLPAPYEAADIAAIKAVAAGTATPDQQKRAMRWLVETVCGTHDLEYRPSSDRDTAFAGGKRFVGLQIVKAVHLDISNMLTQERH